MPVLDRLREPLDRLFSRKPQTYAGQELVGGAMRELTDEPVVVFDRLMRDKPNLVRTRLGPIRTFLVFDAGFARHILREHADNYRRPRFFSRLLMASSGLNVFSAEGTAWRRRRKILSPPFRPGRLDKMGAVMSEEAQRALDRFKHASQPLDIQEEMTQLSINVVGRALFGVDMLEDPRGKELTDGFDGSTQWLNHQRKNVFALPPFVPTKVNRTLHEGKKAVHRVLGDILAERRRSGREAPDMLQMLMEVRYQDTGELLTDQEIIDEMSTFFFAGHETTANNLTWALYLLSKHPEAEDKLRSELKSVLGGRPPRFDDVPKLVYTRQVLEEALRLYPPAWAILREPKKADRLGGYAIPAGSAIYVCVYGIHRHPLYWSRPLEFRPERFEEAAVARRHPQAFIPFGDGPRVCLGGHFAMSEAQIILGTLLQHHRLTTPPEYTPEVETIFTLRARHGIPMTLESLAN